MNWGPDPGRGSDLLLCDHYMPFPHLGLTVPFVSGIEDELDSQDSIMTGRQGYSPTPAHILTILSSVFQCPLPA